MSEENAVFTFEGAEGATYDDFDYSYVVDPGEYTAVVLKAGYHEKDGKVTMRVSFGVHAARPGQGPRVDTYVPVLPGKQRSAIFRAMGVAHLDQQKGKFAYDIAQWKDLECYVTLGQETFKDRLKNNIKAIRPINNDGSPSPRVGGPASSTSAAVGFDE